MSVTTVQVDKSLKITIVDSYVVAYINNSTFACDLHDGIFRRTDGKSQLPEDIISICKQAIIDKKIRINYMITEFIEVEFNCVMGNVSFIIGDCRCIAEAFIAMKKFAYN